MQKCNKRDAGFLHKIEIEILCKHKDKLTQNFPDKNRFAQEEVYAFFLSKI